MNDCRDRHLNNRKNISYIPGRRLDSRTAGSQEQEKDRRVVQPRKCEAGSAVDALLPVLGRWPLLAPRASLRFFSCRGLHPFGLRLLLAWPTKHRPKVSIDICVVVHCRQRDGRHETHTVVYSPPWVSTTLVQISDPGPQVGGCRAALVCLSSTTAQRFLRRHAPVTLLHTSLFFRIHALLSLSLPSSSSSPSVHLVNTVPRLSLLSLSFEHSLIPFSRLRTSHPHSPHPAIIALVGHLALSALQ